MRIPKLTWYRKKYFIAGWGEFSMKDWFDSWAHLDDLISSFGPPAGSTAGQIVYVVPGTPLTIGATDLIGDVTGTAIATQVDAIQGYDVDLTVAPTDGQALVWVNANSQWEAQTVAAATTFASQAEVDDGTIDNKAIAPDTHEEYVGWKHNNLKYITPTAIVGPASGGDYNLPSLFVAGTTNLLQYQPAGNYIYLEPGTYTQADYVIGGTTHTSTYDGRGPLSAVVTAAKVSFLAASTGSLGVTYKNIAFNCTTADLEFELQQGCSITFEDCFFFCAGTFGIRLSDFESNCNVSFNRCIFIGGASTGALVISPATFFGGETYLNECTFAGGQKDVQIVGTNAHIQYCEFNGNVAITNSTNVFSHFTHSNNTDTTSFSMANTYGMLVSECDFKGPVNITTTGDGRVILGQNSYADFPVISGNLFAGTYLDREIETTTVSVALAAGSFLSASSNIANGTNTMAQWQGGANTPITGILLHTQTDAGATGLILKRGYYIAPGIDLSGESLGDPVWVDNTGTLVLVPGESNIQVGYIINLGTGVGDGVIYFDYRFQNLRNSYAFAVPTTAPNTWSVPIEHAFNNQFVNVAVVETASGLFENATGFDIRRDDIDNISLRTVAGFAAGDYLAIITR